MDRGRRLNEILRIVRNGRLHLARDIADALEVSVRTVYRDIDTLLELGVHIEGERGFGYVMRELVFLAPDFLSVEELDALSLGMSIVQGKADEELKAAAQRVLTKMAQANGQTAPGPKAWGFAVYAGDGPQSRLAHMPTLRKAIRNRVYVDLRYADEQGTVSHRTIRPLQIDYWGPVWTCAAWCELRQDFRVFRIDRIQKAVATKRRLQPEAGKTVYDYLAKVAEDLKNQQTH